MILVFQSQLIFLLQLIQFRILNKRENASLSKQFTIIRNSSTLFLMDTIRSSILVDSTIPGASHIDKYIFAWIELLFCHFI